MRLTIVLVFVASAILNLLAVYQMVASRPVSPSVDVGPVLDRIPDVVERAVGLITAVGAIIAVLRGRRDGP
ncbi:hypothetical protein GCM10009681_22170 [Luedemannella helvata]|uniref:Uncharacterized protein n=1 Tax=Luedemannella helvata TaxID=349315 RepID=A0ABN2K9H1_9ACTN